MRKTMTVAVVSAMVGALVAVPIAVYASHSFTDVSDSNTFHEDIAWLADAGVTKGCNPPANTEFCPGDYVTREQMAAFMHRLAENRVVDAATLAGRSAYEIAEVVTNISARRGAALGVTLDPGEEILVAGGCAVEGGHVVGGGGQFDGTGEVVLVESYYDEDITSPTPDNNDLILDFLQSRGWTVSWRNAGDSSATGDFIVTTLCANGGEQLADQLS